MTIPRVPPIQTVSLSLFRFDGLINRAWVIAQMGASRISFRAMPDVQFWKLCGSGTGEGFTPRPNWGVWAILAVWPDADTATARTRDAAVYRRWRAHAGESWTVFLAPISARGRWAGAEPFAVTPLPDGPDANGPDASGPNAHGPVAVLTRATIKPARLLKFWGRVPDISATIGTDPNVVFKIGIGEMPFLHQITFSLWPDPASMAAFARGDGPHGRAIRAVREGDWFREELYARFRILGSTGTWGGVSPLARLAFPTESHAA